MNIAPGYVTPRVISVENAPKEEFTEVFEGAKLVYFTAGAGGKAGENGEAAAERTRKVDWLGAVKVFDAIDDVQGTKPRLILISSVDLRNPSDPAPDHYVSRGCSYMLSTNVVVSRMHKILPCPRDTESSSPTTSIASIRPTRTWLSARLSTGQLSV